MRYYFLLALINDYSSFTGCLLSIQVNKNIFNEMIVKILKRILNFNNTPLI